MRLPSLTHGPDSALVNAVAAASPEWHHGPVRVRSVARIGVSYGLSGGAVYRVEAESMDGSLSVVLKHEGAVAVDRALRFHRALGATLGGSIPTLLGGAVDDDHESGVLLLEDIAPATQGDVLRPCTDWEAAAAVRSLARIHAASWGRDGMPAWTPRVLSPGEWTKRLDAAAARFAPILTAGLRDRLRVTPERAGHAVEALTVGDSCWIHTDAHLDNVLFRPDGTAVLLDWSGVVVGPPAVDLLRLLTEGVNAGARADRAVDLVTVYTDALAASGVHVETDDLWRALAEALVLLAQSAVAWAASGAEHESAARVHALQANFLRSALAWMSNERIAPLPSRR